MTPEDLNKNVISPLAAFYRNVDQRPEQVAFVQPYAGGRVQQWTWAQVADEAETIAAYLQAQGLTVGERVILFSKNCAHWIMADLAIWMAGGVTVPLYPNLAPETISQIIEHSGATRAFLGKLDNFSDMAPGLPDGLPMIRFPDAPERAGAEQWQEILAQGSALNSRLEPDIDALGTIVYTSGTTGMPKGVMHTFRTMGNAGVLSSLLYDTGDQDRCLSYLPLAHVAERAALEMAQLYNGFTVYFAFSLDTFAEDLQRARPTLFFAVPRIWMKFQQGVLAKMPAPRLNRLKRLPIIGGMVRKKILRGLGLDQTRIALSGASPLSVTLIEWYRELGLEIQEGYGMTENFAYSHTTPVGASLPGTVGCANPLVECVISDIGEVLVKSPTTMTGYYKAPEITASTMTEDGFLRTGDQGKIDADGRLHITGRVKELFKTSKGKYVAPAPIENRLLADSLIEQVCVTGANLPQPLAVLNLNETAQAAIADPSARSEIAQQLASHLAAVNATLDPHERLSSLIAVSDRWTPESGFTTPTLKIKRNVIDDSYAAQFEAWQAQSTPIIFL